uniref:BMERB domain-containing protein n=1 Tax=Strongyloides stercoralis TaxID=6248 RepID=A0A0K0E7S4_STRER
MFSISPIIEESTTNSCLSLGESEKKMTTSKKRERVTNKINKVDDKTTPKRGLKFKSGCKTHIKNIPSPRFINNSPLQDKIDNEKILIKAAVELDKDNEILAPETGIVTDFSISEKMMAYKNDKNARFFSYDDVKKIDKSFDIPTSSYIATVSPKIYTNSIETLNSTLDDNNDVFNTTMLEDASEAIDNIMNDQQQSKEEKKVTFAEELIKIDDIGKREEVFAVHDYYYSDDEQTVFHNNSSSNNNTSGMSLDDTCETIVSLSEESDKDINKTLNESFTQDSTATYDPLDLLENRENFNTSFSSTKTAFEIGIPLSSGIETPVKLISSSIANKNYNELRYEVVELKKNQEIIIEMMKNMMEKNEKMLDEVTKCREEMIGTLNNKIFELETELEAADKEIIDCCNRATHYRRIYLELAVEGNKITVEDAVGQMNDPTYNEEYFEKFKKTPQNEIKRSLSSIDMTNKRITIEKLDKPSSSNSTLKRISSFLSPRKINN